MCTVSFVPVHDSVIITSNRDENIQRQNAAAPAFHLLNHKKIIFPKDAKAGGTWFAASHTGTVAVLLNGAFIKHISKPPYRQSRGLVLLDIISGDNPAEFFSKMDLQNIEPFTLILFHPGSLLELRWDGVAKHARQLSVEDNYIWSSATLYKEEVIARREKLFDQFLTDDMNKTPELVHDFHGDDNGDMENGFVIDRDTGIKTFSITQAVIKPASLSFSHHDLLHDKKFSQIIELPETHNKNIREAI